MMNENIGISTVFVCPTLQIRNVLLAVIEKTVGIKPVAQRNSQSAQRALYDEARSRVIINTASERMYPYS